MKTTIYKRSLLGVVFIFVCLAWAYTNGRPSPTYLQMTVKILPQFRQRAQTMDTLFFIFRKDAAPSSPVWLVYRERLASPLTDSRQFSFRKENIQLVNGDWQQMPARLHVQVRLDLDGLAGPDQPGDMIGWSPGQNLGGNATIELDTLVDSLPPDLATKQWDQLRARDPNFQSREDLFGVPERDIFREMRSWIDEREIFEKDLENSGV